MDGGDGAGAGPRDKLEVPRIRSESVDVIAQAVLGVAPGSLPEPVCQLVAADAEYRVREVVQESMKFMRHSKRGSLTAGDVQAGLRQLNIPPVYAISNTDPVEFASVHASPGLFYVRDKELLIADLVQADLPPLPNAATLSMHWLAVEGTQPLIPENAVPSPHGNHDRTNKMTNGSHAHMPKKQRVEGASAGFEVPKALSTGHSGSGHDAEIKAVKKHALSKELSIYLASLTEAIHGTHADLRDAAFASVSEEPGLQALLPYLVQYVEQQLKHMSKTHTFDLARLFSCMQLVRAILKNPYFYQIDKYLHRLLPSIMTCLVGKRLSATKSENHWELRDCAADILLNICTKFGVTYTNIQSHITKTLSSALQDSSKPLTSQYGAVVGLSVFGRHVFESILLPFVRVYVPVLEEELAGVSSLRTGQVEELWKVYGAFLAATSVHALKIEANDSVTPDGTGFSTDTDTAGLRGMSSVLVPSAHSPLGNTAMSDSPRANGSSRKWIPLWKEAPRVSIERLESLSDAEKAAVEEHFSDLPVKLRRLRDALQSSACSCLPF
ncbi:Transcription initiation factor TFIID subunit 6 [Porphyridium purpureum]|uniref:Transcription initiation factor TFIID subunit 6 n=1 Tax=Porphyridium purpureum TaxID=35688 RepID=A0A5J4Z9Q1_PORPP|nr:Transcription initiation factor TFIID subunit 6 [Porphyridium purpureum]|eukprot:POR0947..scf295_1